MKSKVNTQDNEVNIQPFLNHFINAQILDSLFLKIFWFETTGILGIYKTPG